MSRRPKRRAAKRTAKRRASGAVKRRASGAVKRRASGTAKRAASGTAKRRASGNATPPASATDERPAIAAQRRLRLEVSRLRALLADSEETVRAIRFGEVDALVLHGARGEQIFTLRGAESSYRLLVETMSEGAATFSESGTIPYCNQCFAQLLGRPLERIMGAHIQEFVAPEHAAIFGALLSQGLHGAARSELSFSDAEAQRVPTHVSLSPLRGDDGTGVVCLVVTNLSGQKRSEEMLASERLAASVIEQANDAILVCDNDGRIIRASERASGVARQRPLFSRFNDAFPSPPLRSIISSALDGKRSQGVAASIESEEGARLEVLGSGAPLLGKQGNIVGAIVTLSDISALNRTQKELERAVKLRDEFMLIAAHELRTPLTSLLLQLDSLHRVLERGADSLASAARWKGKLDTALRQAQRLITLTDSLLDTSRLRTGRLKLELEELDLTSVVREVVERWRAEAARSGCELRFHAEGPSVAAWDRIRIEQALVNLIRNATKYAPGRPVEVNVATRAETVEITVADQGIGIDAADQARIFELFERAVPSEHYGGMGVGLFVTRQIAEACGGSIDVASEPGRGASFRLSLPMRSDASERAPTPARPAVEA